MTTSWLPGDPLKSRYADGRLGDMGMDDGARALGERVSAGSSGSTGIAAGAEGQHGEAKLDEMVHRLDVNSSFGMRSTDESPEEMLTRMRLHQPAKHAALHDLSQPAALGDAWTSPSLYGASMSSSTQLSSSSRRQRQPPPPPPPQPPWNDSLVAACGTRTDPAGDAMGWGATHGLDGMASQAAAHATLRASCPGRTTC